MYLLLNGDEKIIIETIKELEGKNFDGYKIFALSPVDKSELISDGEIRDTIYGILKEKQMSKNKVIEIAQNILDISEAKINKVINKMKKEKIIYTVDDLRDLNGEKWIGIE